MIWPRRSPGSAPALPCFQREAADYSGSGAFNGSASRKQEAGGADRGSTVDCGVPSNSLLRWRGPVRADLDDIVDAHASVAGVARGRRAATAQVTQAYAVLLSSHFQRFCRDLHSEAIEHVAASLAEPWARPIMKLRLTEGRKLDTGNPNPGNIGSDFNRFGFNLWSRMADLDKRTPGRKSKLERLNRWRNAIAHQDFGDTVGLDLDGGRTDLRIADVAGWRTACDQLASTMDAAVLAHLSALVGGSPW